MEKEENTNFCLSGKPKPFSHKRENSEKKSKDIFSRLRSVAKSSESELATKERPRTAVKKSSSNKIPPANQQQSSSRPSSATTMTKMSYASKFRFPPLKSTKSIDSAVGSQHSSTDDDNKSSDDNEENESQDNFTSDDDAEESSEDSGIIKVRVVSRNTNESSEANSNASSPTARSILVKEFNRTPDLIDDENVPEELECEEYIESEDEESKAEPLPVKFPSINIAATESEDVIDDKDVVLLELGPEDSSEIIPKVYQEITATDVSDSGIEINQLTIDDIESNNDDVFKDQDTTFIDSSKEVMEAHVTGEENQSHDSHSDFTNKSYDPKNYNLYDPKNYKNENNQQNSSLLELVKEKGDSKIKTEDDISYENLIKSTILKLENEETKPIEVDVDGDKNSLVKDDGNKDEDRLTNEELENLKKKCLSRMKENQNTPLVVNPPVLHEFSNSQKLLNFLDEAEEKDVTVLNSVKRSSYNLQAGQSKSNLPSLSELLTKSVAELSEEVMTLKLELETERRSCAVLRTGLEQQQRTAGEKSKQLVKESKQRLDAQRHEYEAAIARHQSFIDQLIEDKKSISQKCEALTTELRNNERRNKENVKAMESRHSMEMNRVKQINDSADRLKRERWMDQKAKKIKEQTVKSLETEVQKIMSRHATEMSEIKAKHKQELETQELGLREHFQKYFDQVKLEAERDKKEMLEQEKLFQLERFRKQSDQMESFHQAEVGRLKDEIERERERREEERQKWVLEAEQIRKISKERGNLEVERIKEEMEEMKKSLVRRHANEMTTLKANEESERKEFERKVRDKMEKDWYDKESHLRSQFTRERDQEIDRVIEKLEFEMKKVREDGEKSTEARIARLKSKHENEVGELIKEIEDHKFKTNELKERLSHKEGEALMLASVNKQMEIQTNELESIKTKLIKERNDVAAVVRKEFADNLDMLTEENTKLKTELNQQVVNHKSALLEKDLNLRAAQNDFEKNIHQLHEKVQNTVEKKEKVIEELRSQYEMAVEKISQLESIITQQSVDIVSKNKRSNSNIERVLKNQSVDDSKMAKRK